MKAAREKNGVYVPHERFLQEEAEKKVYFYWIFSENSILCILELNDPSPQLTMKLLPHYAGNERENRTFGDWSRSQEKGRSWCVLFFSGTTLYQHAKLTFSSFRQQADSFQELYHSEQEKNLDLDCEIKKHKVKLASSILKVTASIDWSFLLWNHLQGIMEESKKAFSDLQEEYRKMSLLLKEKDHMISKLRSSG